MKSSVSGENTETYFWHLFLNWATILNPRDVSMIIGILFHSVSSSGLWLLIAISSETGFDKRVWKQEKTTLCLWINHPEMQVEAISSGSFVVTSVEMEWNTSCRNFTNLAQFIMTRTLELDASGHFQMIRFYTSARRPTLTAIWKEKKKSQLIPLGGKKNQEKAEDIKAQMAPTTYEWSNERKLTHAHYLG